MITRDRQEEQLKVGSGIDRQKQQRVQVNTAVQEVQALRPTATPVNRYVAPVSRDPEKGFVNELLSGLSSLAPAVNKLYMAREEKLFKDAQEQAERDVQQLSFDEVQKKVASGELDQAANPYYQAAYNKTYGVRAGIELKNRMAQAYETDFDKDSGDIDEFFSQMMADQRTQFADNEFAMQGFDNAMKGVREKFVGAQNDYKTQKKKEETYDSIFAVVSETIATMKEAGLTPEEISSQLNVLGQGYKKTMGVEYAEFDRIILSALSGYAEKGDTDLVNGVLDDSRGGLGPLSGKTSLLKETNTLKTAATEQRTKNIYQSGMDLRFMFENQADNGQLDYKALRAALDSGRIKEADYAKFDAQNDAALRRLKGDNDKLKNKLDADAAFSDILNMNMQLLAEGNSSAIYDKVIPDGNGSTRVYTAAQQIADAKNEVLSVFKNSQQKVDQDGNVPVSASIARLIKATTGENVQPGNRIPLADLSRYSANTMMYLGLEDTQTKSAFGRVLTRINEEDLTPQMTSDMVNSMATLTTVYEAKGIAGVSQYLGNAEEAMIFEHATDLIKEGYDQTTALREAIGFSRTLAGATRSQKQRVSRVESAVEQMLIGSEVSQKIFGDVTGVSPEVTQHLSRKSAIYAMRANEGSDEDAIAKNVISNINTNDISVIDGYMQLVPKTVNYNGRTFETSRVFSERKHQLIKELYAKGDDPNYIISVGNVDREPGIFSDAWSNAWDWFTDGDKTKGLNREYITADNLVFYKVPGSSGGKDVWRLTTKNGSTMPLTVVNTKTGERTPLEFTTKDIVNPWGSLNEELERERSSANKSSVQGSQELRAYENQQRKERIKETERRFEELKKSNKRGGGSPFPTIDSLTEGDNQVGVKLDGYSDEEIQMLKDLVNNFNT